MSRLFFHQRRKGLGFIPAVTSGFTLIIPETAAADAHRYGGPQWSTDGANWYRDDHVEKEFSTIDVARSLLQQGADTPISVDGNVFARVQRHGGDGYRVTMVDPGYLDPGDRDALISLSPGWRGAIVTDALAKGEILSDEDGKVAVRIPAGAFRIVDFEVVEGP